MVWFYVKNKKLDFFTVTFKKPLKAPEKRERCETYELNLRTMGSTPQKWTK